MKLTSILLLGGALSSASYSAHALNGADLGLSHGEVEAAYTAVSPDGLTRSYVSSGQSMPRKEIRLSDSTCRNGPDNGGHCIKLAGGGAFGEVASVQFLWRLSDKGHNSAWEPCTRGSGCRASNHEIYPNGRTVATFLISHVDPDGARDLRMDIVFKKLASPPVAQAERPTKKDESDYPGNRAGKHN